MGHPLDSAFAKLTRASEHLEEAEAEQRRFIQTNPYATVVQYHFHSGKDDPDGGVEHWHEIKLRVLGEPPLRLRLLIADSLQNIRSALDHLVFELAALDPVKPRGERTQFPIHDSPKLFEAKKGIHLQGVPEPYRTQFEQVQPYQTGYAILAALRDLNDRDKHRSLDLVISKAKLMQLRFDPDDAVTDGRQNPEAIYFEDGAVLAVFRSAREVKVERTLTFEIGAGIRGGPVIGLPGLRLLLKIASDTIASFRVAFDLPHRHEGQVSHDPPPAPSAERPFG